MPKLKTILHELREHIPFTASASLSAVIIIALIFNFNSAFIGKISESFETIHGLHILVSAIVATAIFYKYKKNIPASIVVGILSSVIIGSLSDVILPYLGGELMGMNLGFHLPVFENPIIILGTALFGCILGLATKLTKLPHFLHIFLSTFASLFYLTLYAPVLTILSFIGIFFIVFIAVIIPCCASDIIFPLIFLGEKH